MSVLLDGEINYVCYSTSEQLLMLTSVVILLQPSGTLSSCYFASLPVRAVRKLL